MPEARPAIRANGAHIRKARTDKRHKNTHAKHSRVRDKIHLAKHGLKRG